MTTNPRQIALNFAEALIAADYPTAYGMLTPAVGLNAAELQEKFESMISYWETEPTQAEVVETLETWPDRQPTDRLWAYVSIDDALRYAEAVTVVVAEDGDQLGIRSIEWGRP
jgi:hypothetical protein